MTRSLNISSVTCNETDFFLGTCNQRSSIFDLLPSDSMFKLQNSDCVSTAEKASDFAEFNMNSTQKSLLSINVSF